jgi:hypothetical protein
MELYFVTYKGRILAGPMPKEDAEQKLVKLGYCFRNVMVMPGVKVKKKRKAEVQAQ